MSQHVMKISGREYKAQVKELSADHALVVVDGKEYFDDLGRNGREKEFFDAMRKGAAPVTSLLPTAAYEEYFEPVFAAGRDILFVAFSSQLSGTIQNIYAAREELLQRYPERRMIVVDTLSISLPQSILVLKAHELYRQGKTMDEVAAWLEENKSRSQAFFTVDDLTYLRRGGRISAVAATVGTMLDLKPIITEGKNGKLLSTDEKLYQDLSASVANIRSITDKVGSGEGTLGRLVNDDEIYTEAQKLLAELRAAIDDMRETSPVTTFSTVLFGAF